MPVVRRFPARRVIGQTIAACTLALVGSALAAPSGASTDSGGASAPKLRLGDVAKPLRYAARLTVVPTEPTFSGQIDIELAFARPSTSLWLNATNLKVARASFVVKGQTIAARVVPGGEDFVGFAVDKPIEAGPARLHVEYSGELSRKDDRGLFAQKEGDHWYAITQFEAIFARRAFPCFDEPNYKTPWQLTLEVKKADVALSNTPVVSEKEERPGMKTVAFAATKPLPSYLVAFAVGPYEVVDGGRAGLNKAPVRVAAPAGRGRDARYAASISSTLVELLEKYFGIAYPYEKLDAVAIPLPTEFGAMENPGAVTFAQNLLVARPEDESITFRRNYAFVAAHEFAHQWFGDLVTTAWWNDIWLNESFATWLEQKIIDQWKPEWSHHIEGVKARGEAMEADSLLTARKIRQPIESNDDIYNAFDFITYQKGASVLNMFESYVGPEAFQRGVRRYLQQHAHGNATADDFVGAISAAAGRDVGPAFASFLNQPGVPLVTMGLRCDAGKAPVLTLSQQRYLPIGTRSSGGESWKVPVCAKYPVGSGVERSCTLLSEREAALTLDHAKQCPAWVLGNDGMVGYYRGAYQGDLMKRLLGDGLKQLALPEVVGLIDDSDALMRNGSLAVADLLALVPPLAADPRREVVAKLARIVETLHAHMVPAGLQANYARLVQSLFGARARALGWTPKADEDEDTRLLRPTLVSLVADGGADRPLRAEAVKLARRWMDDRKAIDNNIVTAVLQVAAHAGDRVLFDRMVAEAKRSTERRDRERLLTALGNFHEPALVKRALALTLSDDFDARESLNALWPEENYAGSRQAAWDFMKKNYDALLKRQPAESMAALPFLGVALCDEAHKKDMDAFFRDRAAKLPGGPRELAQALESISQCAALTNAQHASAEAFLRRY